MTERVTLTDLRSRRGDETVATFGFDDDLPALPRGKGVNLLLADRSSLRRKAVVRLVSHSRCASGERSGSLGARMTLELWSADHLDDAEMQDARERLHIRARASVIGGCTSY
jgi:hypothetical protein